MKSDYKSLNPAVAVYALKPGTTSSYYWQRGTRVMPNRLSIFPTDMTPTAKKGRNLQPSAGQMKSTFTKAEESPLKQHRPWDCNTKLWQVPEFPDFIGYGTLGITAESGRIEGDTNNLVALFTPDAWKTIAVFYFPGMGDNNPDHLQAAMQKAAELVSQGNVFE